MGMYYQGSSEIQADGLQTLYLMNPNYIGYSDTQQQQQQQQQQTSMLFLNSAAASGSALSAANFPHAALQSQSQVQAQAQHFVGVPLPATLHDLSRQSVHDVSASHHGLIQRLWNQNGGGGGGGSSGVNESRPHIPSSTVVSPNSGGGGTTTDFASQLGFQRPMVVSPTQHHQGGLSLSLSPQQQQQNLNFRSLPLDHHHHHDISTQNYQGGILSSSSPRTTNNNNNDHIRGSGASSSSVTNGISGMILGSKYLKAAQVLLDEVVNVGKNIINGGEDGFETEAKEKRKLNNESNIPLGSDTVGGESSKNGVAELTTAQRQELQMKKAKLLSMLDEVEQRYRQYHHQMQIIVASFEQAAGIGSAKSYTQLALHTISKQFRSLKDGIAGQIKATSKSLGEEDNSGGKIEGSRLKYVDHHLRQQCALQQLGMMQPNAWRPQRGLPERAVSVLRAWLFEHFLHPYPKDSDKIMLAKQTGLTRSQVSNWFINARVRLWKPMVEEMYLEEVKNQEQNGLEGNTNKNIVEANNKLEVGSKSSAPQDPTKLIRKDKQEKSRNMHDTSPTQISTSTISTSPNGSSLQAQAAGFSFIGSLNMANAAERNGKRTRNDVVQNSPSSILSVDMETKALEITNKGLINNERQTRDDQSYSLMTDYTMGDFGRFNPEHQLATSFHGNGVSLTLGLPPSENQHNFNIGMGSRLDQSHFDRMGNPQATHQNISYETIDFQSGKRFAAQLLPDFVS